MKKLFSDHIQKLFLLENSDFERIGTGKIAGILDKGVVNWVRLLHVFVRNSAAFLVTIIIATIVIIKSAPIFLIGFILLISLSLAVNRYVSRATEKAKAERTILVREAERHVVRMAMSKFEVLQNDRIASEIDISKSNFDKLEPASEVSEWYSRLSSAVPF